MKKIFTLAAIAAFNLMAGQKNTDLKDFKSISIGQDMKVKLIQSSENKLTVSDGEEDELEISNDGGHLTLDGDAIIVIYYKDDLESITVGSDSEILGADEIKSQELRLTVGTDAVVKLKINVQKLYTYADADSKIKLTGKAIQHSATLSSDVQMSANDLLTDISNITLSSDAQASINTKGIVNATVSSDASLKIYGNPKKVNKVTGEDSEIVVVK